MNRLPSIDVLRVVVVVVVVRHVFLDLPFIVSAGSPFFFLLAGWLWAPGRRTVREEIRARWLTLMRPYIVWFGLIWVIFAGVLIARGDFSSSTLLRPLLGGEFAGRPFTTFWFISALFVAVVLMRVLDGVARWKAAVLAAVLLTVFTAAGPLASHVPWAVGTGVLSVSFVITGWLLRGVTRSLVGRRRTVAAVGAVALSAVLILLEPGSLDLKNGELGTPVLSIVSAIIITWAGLLLLDEVFQLLPRVAEVARRVFTPLATVAIGVVFVHPLFLLLLDVQQTSSTFLDLVAVLVLSWTTVLVIWRTPAATWLLGERASVARKAPLAGERVAA